MGHLEHELLESAGATSEFQQLLQWIGLGVERMEDIADDTLREEVFALLEGIDVLHRHALTRMIEVIDTTGGQAVVDRVIHDPTVRTLLAMYDLPEQDERAQVEAALQPAREYIQSHGGSLDLLGVEGGRVRVRLSGSCGSCPGSSNTVERVVEDTLRERFPQFQELIAEVPPAPERVPIQLVPRVLRRPRWFSVGQLPDFPEGALHGLWPEGQAVLVVRLGGEVYAFQNGCPPGSALVLHLSSLEGTTLVCPWHGCRYDVRTGQRLDAEGKLGVLPVAVQDDVVKIAMGVEEVTVG